MIELLSLILIVLLIKVVFNISYSQSLFSPSRMLGLLIAFYVVIPVFLMFLIGFETDYYYVNGSRFYQSLLIVFLFYLCFFFSSMLMFKSGARDGHLVKGKNFGGSVAMLATVFLFLSLFSKLYLVTKGVFFLEDKYSDSFLVAIPAPIKFFNNIHLVGLAFLMAYVVKPGRNVGDFTRWLFYVLFSYSVFVAVIQGRRFGVVFPIIMFLIVYSARYSFPMKKVIAWGGGLGCVFFVITLLRLSQAMAYSQGESEGGAFSYLFGPGGEEVLRGVAASIVSRIGNPVIIISHINDIRLDYGWSSSFNSLKLVASSLVPSAFWGDKPPISIGNLFGIEVGLINVENVATKINPGWIGESYYNSGLSGVVFGAVLLGLFSKLYFSLFVGFESDLGLVFLLQYFVFMFSGFQMEIAFSINTLVKATVMIFGIYYVTSVLGKGIRL